MLFKSGKYDEALRVLSEIEVKEGTASYIEDFRKKIISVRGGDDTTQKE